MNNLLRLMVTKSSLLSLFGVLSAFPAIAADETKKADGYFLEPGIHSEFKEFRFGVLSYDSGVFSPKEYNGVVLNGEFLFTSPDFLSSIGSPRPYIGFDAAVAENPIHFAYVGLSWDFRLYKKLYLTTSLGGAVTTAKELYSPDGYKAMGSRVLFHLGAGLGYDFNENWTAQLYADHFSNANLGKRNEGAEAAGIRIGYRF